jgi:zinc finger protein
LTNVEGIVSGVAEDLQQGQEARREVAPFIADQIQEIIRKLRDMAEGKTKPFRLTLDDPAGNSYIEPPQKVGAGKYTRKNYVRTPEQNEALGLAPHADMETTHEQQEDSHAKQEDMSQSNGVETTSTASAQLSQTEGSTEAPPPLLRPEYHATHLYPSMQHTSLENLDATSKSTAESHAQGTTTNENDDDDEIHNLQVYTFPASCPSCMSPCTTNMKNVDVPYFQSVILMSTICDYCGYKSNEVKTGGAVPEKGRRITVKVSETSKKKTEDDGGTEVNKGDGGQGLNRDILKSETCALYVPEIGLQVEPGSHGGRFTTVEGLLTQCRDDLRKSKFGDEDPSVSDLAGGKTMTLSSGYGGDSMSTSEKERWRVFFERMDECIAGTRAFTVVLEDPLASSYVQSLRDDGEADEWLTVEEYTRTKDEEEWLGLADIVTEGYGEDGEQGSEPKQEEKESVTNEGAHSTPATATNQEVNTEKVPDKDGS